MSFVDRGTEAAGVLVEVESKLSVVIRCSGVAMSHDALRCFSLFWDEKQIGFWVTNHVCRQGACDNLTPTHGQHLLIDA